MDRDLEREWIEADGLGGFASGTVGLFRTRRYHALLLSAETPPTGRVVLVNGFEAVLLTPAGRYALSAQHYAPDVYHPDGYTHIERFSAEPWPCWRFALPDGSVVEQELFAVHGQARVVVRFRLLTPRPDTWLELRPLISGRDYHGLQRENGGFRFEADVCGERVRLKPYPDIPTISWYANAEYQPSPDWYRNFLYRAEQERGLDCVEDLAAPGVLRFDLSAGDAAWVLGTELREAMPDKEGMPALELAATIAERERTRRAAFASCAHRAADAYIVRRGAGQTIIAGYPWFTDWGRDAFIALRGLCIATRQLETARSILCEWASAVSDGMLPNRFADHGEAPEYNSVDASLWYVVAVRDFLQASGDTLGQGDRQALCRACDAIVAGYAGGTRYGIRLDRDGLLAAGMPGVQLTWMDAKIGDWVVTPRVGKPVEIQALWLNALAASLNWSERWRADFERGRAAFVERFWNEPAGALYDVVDVDHEPGRIDASFRPNQVLAVGGLPLMLLDRARALRMIDAVQARLVTPLGLRSLAPDEPGYAPRYQGGPRERDATYHQGTVWPWLLGPFVEAFVRVHGGGAQVKREARARFVAPLRAYADRERFGHVCEIADAEAPHASRGCPFQAWSLGELLRLELDVLGEPLAETAPQMSFLPGAPRVRVSAKGG